MLKLARCFIPTHIVYKADDPNVLILTKGSG